MTRTVQRIEPTEEDEQVTLFALIEHQLDRYPALAWLTHIPNGGLRHILVARKLKRAGVKSGCPDLFLPCPLGPFAGLFIEMKSARGQLQPAQRRWLVYLQRAGYAVAVCRSATQALAVLTGYLSGSVFVGRELVRFEVPPFPFSPTPQAALESMIPPGNGLFPMRKGARG